MQRNPFLNVRVFTLLLLCRSFRIITRQQWGALFPISEIHLPHRLSYVIIHHTYIPDACIIASECAERMRYIQHMHMDTNGWEDIGYNFAIGGDGNVYEGRGFAIQGAHAKGFNNNSIGIVLIGDWTDDIPNSLMIQRTHDLIAYAIERGYIRSDYELYGHRQVRDTECPGNALFAEVQLWPHWQKGNYNNL